MTYYKFLRVGGVSAYVEGFQWLLPTKNSDGSWAPGEWMPEVEQLELCDSGYHVCTRDDMVRWNDEELYEIDVRGEHLEGLEKSCWQQARLLRRIETWDEQARCLFSCDCVEHILHLFEAEYPDDKRPRTAIEVARRYVNGEGTKQEMDAASVAANNASDDGAWNAVWTAIGPAACEAVRKWQDDRLWMYLDGEIA